MKTEIKKQEQKYDNSKLMKTVMRCNKQTLESPNNGSCVNKNRNMG